MLVLALDTTTRRGSMALARDGVVFGIYQGDASVTHGERLPGDLVRLLRAHGLDVGDVDLFAVASGPGSFTGLRIGIATMQGLALANGKPLAGVSALDALHESAHAAPGQPDSAASGRRHEGRVAVWMDAQRGQVFSAVYADAALSEPAIVEKPAEILARWRRDGSWPRVFIGDGALAYRPLILRVLPDSHVVEPLPPLAPGIAHLAERQVQDHGPSPPDAIRPVYIRRSDAELARDRAAAFSKP
jgi:tRNA threonylcarbamoyladenosine biosynthesis protein TsaB